MTWAGISTRLVEDAETISSASVCTELDAPETFGSGEAKGDEEDANPGDNMGVMLKGSGKG